MGMLKRCVDDFIFLRIIGEGSFSVVYLARDIPTKLECAVKVCEKQLISREQMTKAIFREKRIHQKILDYPSPFLIKLICTFQNEARLFFATNYCCNGELLSFINQREVFDEKACLFYAAEILLALEHLHRLGIIHRDLKPENVLLNERMHIQITDFGSAVMTNDPTPVDRFDRPRGGTSSTAAAVGTYRNRKNTFVGTAQYVSPEMLNNKKITPMCDLWALGCMIYQMFTNRPPFVGGNDYLIFQKIQALEYSFPDDFPPVARSLVESLLKFDASDRLGAEDATKLESLEGNSSTSVLHDFTYTIIRSHPFFESVDDWNYESKQPPPKILACAKTESGVEDDDSEPGLTEKQIANLLGLQLHDENQQNTRLSKKSIYKLTPEEYTEKMKDQKLNNRFHQFVEDNLILRQGLIDKRKGLFARRRMFLLTTGPHLYYVDPANMELKGEVPFSNKMKCERKNFRNFYIHTPDRTYILECVSNNSPSWCSNIDEVKQFYYDDTFAEAALDGDSGKSDQPSASSGNVDYKASQFISRKPSKNKLFTLNRRKIPENTKLSS